LYEVSECEWKRNVRQFLFVEHFLPSVSDFEA
jgi:hypothetical protein